MAMPKYRMIKSQFVVKVVGKSDDAVKRVQDILLDVDAEYHVPGGRQTLWLTALPGRQPSAEDGWWDYNVEWNEATGFCSMELEGHTYDWSKWGLDQEFRDLTSGAAAEICHAFQKICKGLDVGVSFYVSNADKWEQRSFAVNHLGVVTSVHEDAFNSPLEDEDGNPREVSEDDLKPDEWGWPYWGCFDLDADIYAGVK